MSKMYASTIIEGVEIFKDFHFKKSWNDKDGIKEPLFKIEFIGKKARVYSIADHLDFWKEITVKHNGYLDVESLSKNSRNIDITIIKRKAGEFSVGEDEVFYTMFHSELNEQRKKELDRVFFSDLVLGNYFYIITDKNGKIKAMSWDKP